MTRYLILVFLALPLTAQTIDWRGGARAGCFKGGQNDPCAFTLELDARNGGWSFAPAGEFIMLSDNTRAIHLNIRRYIQNFWIGAGPTWVHSDAPSSDHGWNVDLGLGLPNHTKWQPYVAARFYSFDMPIFRDRIRASGALVSLGVSRRLH